MVLNVTKVSDTAGLTLEAWAEGFMFGALVIMSCISEFDQHSYTLVC